MLKEITTKHIADWLHYDKDEVDISFIKAGFYELKATPLELVELGLKHKNEWVMLQILLRPEIISKKNLCELACDFAEKTLIGEQEIGREPKDILWQAIEVRRAQNKKKIGCIGRGALEKIGLEVIKELGSKRSEFNFSRSKSLRSTISSIEAVFSAVWLSAPKAAKKASEDAAWWECLVARDYALRKMYSWQLEKVIEILKKQEKES